MTAGGQPDVVIVVLDCVRAQDFPGGATPLDEMGAVESLIRESVAFPRAVAPTPWTLPSHASILTGLEPWEHNLHLRGQLVLDPSLVTLPAILRESGYATVLLSGNALLSAETGFSTQFQASATSQWWEPFLRHTTFRQQLQNATQKRIEPATRGPQTFQRLAVELLLRYPMFMDAADRISAHALDSENVRGAVSPWIEPTFDGWLEQQPANRPVFALINLIDAHDPYLTRSVVNDGFRSWWHFASVPQQSVAYRFRGVEATPERMEVLRTLYRAAVRSLDRRIAHLIASLRRANRWENTLFVLTSDHGQALLEKGHLFHGLRVDEQLTRIPLVVKLPGGEQAGSSAEGWATLPDISPLVCRLAGVSSPPASSSVDLLKLLDSPRPRPAVSVSDGIVGGRTAADWIPKWALAGLYKVMAAVYSDDWKVIVDQTDEGNAVYNIAADPGEQQNVWRERSGELAEQAAVGRNVIERMILAHRPTGVEGVAQRLEVARRLEGWGYV